MGNLRTPRPHYFNNGVIEFYVYKKEIYYKTKLWLQDGLSQIVFEDKKFLGDVNSIVKRTLQSFTNVEVEP